MQRLCYSITEIPIYLEAHISKTLNIATTVCQHKSPKRLTLLYKTTFYRKEPEWMFENNQETQFSAKRGKAARPQNWNIKEGRCVSGAAFEGDSTKSVQRAGYDVQTPQAGGHKLLHKRFHLHPYKLLLFPRRKVDNSGR